jgi:hypothetical protein
MVSTSPTSQGGRCGLQLFDLQAIHSSVPTQCGLQKASFCMRAYIHSQPHVFGPIGVRDQVQNHLLFSQALCFTGCRPVLIPVLITKARGHIVIICRDFLRQESRMHLDHFRFAAYRHKGRGVDIFTTMHQLEHIPVSLSLAITPSGCNMCCDVGSINSIN